MYARVARWENAEPQALRDSAERISADAASGPPEGVPAKGLLLLTDPDNGRAMAVTFFESEEDLRKGDETLSAMNPPGGGMGSRVGVEMYRVAAELNLSSRGPVA